MKPKIVVAKPGKNWDSTDPLDFILNTDFENVMFYQDEIISVSVAGNSSVKSILNFSYTFDTPPMVLLFVELTPGSNDWVYAPFTFDSTDPENFYLVQDAVSDTGVEVDKFYLTLHNKTGSTKTVRYHYFILINTA